jgi:nitrite reductase/ring-hydroxylating ferredoxin subunit
MQPASGNLLRIELPEANKLDIGQTMTFSYRRQGDVEQGFVLRLESGFVAFANRCPHWNIDLDVGDSRFYDPRVQRIYCRNHGATFLPADGLCDAGPCKGMSLESFQVSSMENAVIVEIEDAEAV